MVWVIVRHPPEVWIPGVMGSVMIRPSQASGLSFYSDIPLFQIQRGQESFGVFLSQMSPGTPALVTLVAAILRIPLASL
jgi:hypothetical protein